MAEEVEEVVVTARRGSGGSANFYGGFGGTALDASILAQYFAAEALQSSQLAEVVVRAPKPAPAPPPPPTLRPPSAPVMPSLPSAGETLAEIVISGARPKPRTPPPKRTAPRRSPPPKTRPGRRRPTTRPSPGRIPIPTPIPEVVVRGTRAASRRFPILALVGPLIGALAAVDRYGTQNMFDRMYGGPNDDEDRDPGQPPAERRDPTPVPEGDVSAGSPMPVITVTGSRPFLGVPTVRPGGASAPLGSPSLLPISLVEPRIPISPRPEQAARPRPQPTPSPRIVSDPLTLSPPVPALQPLPAPRFPGPEAAPRPPKAPIRPVLPTPLTPIQGLVVPSPKPSPVPVLDLDKCNCAKKPEKNRKKRKPRTECKQGTYRQTAMGITYKPRRTVPCQ